jgi:hypothetical protein
VSITFRKYFAPPVILVSDQPSGFCLGITTELIDGDWWKDSGVTGLHRSPEVSGSQTLMNNGRTLNRQKELGKGDRGVRKKIQKIKSKSPKDPKGSKTYQNETEITGSS